MSSERPSTERFAIALTALAALALIAALFAAPASAAKASGKAAMILAEHDRGRTLSGQGVKILPGAPATREGRQLDLPIAAVEPGAAASATGEGSLSFETGRRSVVLSEIRFNLSAGTLSGKLDGEQLDVFKVAGPATANASSGNVALDGGKLFLTPEAASKLKQKLALKRALRRNGVGMAWLAAKANPTREARTVVSGNAGWGVLASWRGYILANIPPPPPTNGTIEVTGGASANGPLASPATTYVFPAVSGTFERGLYGATDRLVLKTQGGVTFKKPGHCIMEVALADLELTLDGASSSLTLNARYDTDGGPPHVCNVNLPTVSTDGVKFADLDLSAVTPAYAADGSTVTWGEIPVTLTAAGASAFGAGYEAGQPLDPVTITVGLG